VWLARSEACEHQAFAVGARVLGLQFHLEMTPDDVARIAKECANELTAGKFVQSAEAIIARAAQENAAGALMGRLLTRLERG
jgi:GMP synthase-like glutamine amidotransferase